MTTGSDTEERLRRALAQAGSTREVDVVALHALTRRRWADPERGHGPRRGRGRGRAGFAVPVGLAAVAALVVAGLVVGRLGDGDGDTAATEGEGGVAASFTCPQRRTTSLPSRTDDSFLPKIDDGLRPTGEARAAPRWESTRTNGGVVLRLGNADGSLASVVRFTPGSGEGEASWVAAEVTKCVNDAGPAGTSDPSTLLVQPDVPVPEDALTSQDVGADAVKFVDRVTYDTVGLAKQYAVWASPCGDRVCVTAGSGRYDTMLSGRLPNGDPRPLDETQLLADPDDVEGQSPGLRLILVRDSADELASVAWATAGNPGVESSTQVPAVSGDWSGGLYAFIAPTDRLGRVTLTGRDGTETIVDASDIATG